MYEGFSTIGSLVSRYEGFTNGGGTNNAVCQPNVNLNNITFPDYVNQCLQEVQGDSARVTNSFSYLQQQFIDAWATTRAEFGNLLNTYNGINTLQEKTSSTTRDADNSLIVLTKKKKQLEEDLKRYKSEAEAKNQSFLDSILQGRPQETLAPTLQDATLMLFWFGWILLGATLILVRWLSPGGSWHSAVFATVLLLLATLCIYAVLQKVA